LRREDRCSEKNLLFLYRAWRELNLLSLERKRMRIMKMKTLKKIQNEIEEIRDTKRKLENNPLPESEKEKISNFLLPS